MVIGDDRETYFEYTQFLALGPALPFRTFGGCFSSVAAPSRCRKCTASFEEGCGSRRGRVGPGRNRDRLAAISGSVNIRRFAPSAAMGGARSSVLKENGISSWATPIGACRNIPHHLVTREFFAEVRERLAPGGAMLLNLIAARSGAWRCTLRLGLPDDGRGIPRCVGVRHRPSGAWHRAEYFAACFQGRRPRAAAHADRPAGVGPQTQLRGEIARRSALAEGLRPGDDR